MTPTTAVKHVLGREARFVWHKETSLGGAGAVILPGGFSYGDYLRSGAIARFSPIMGEVARFAAAGGPVLGICNGFQVLLEAGLLPGGMRRNRRLKFICEHVHLRVEQTDTPFTRLAARGRVLRIPIAHGEGNYYADPERRSPPWRANRQIIFRYTAAGRQPRRGLERERVDRRHRRPVQRGAQRGRHDAAPGAGRARRRSAARTAASSWSPPVAALAPPRARSRARRRRSHDRPADDRGARP